MRIGRIACGAIVVSLIGSLGGCTIRDDSVRENQLDSLRVLGIASEPADLAVGESADLRALVYAPDSQAISYSWSWCPSRSGGDDGFVCLIDEAELQAAWATLDTGTDLPPYDLGSAETATFDLAFEATQALALCQILTSDAPNPQLALFECLSGLSLTIELRVRTASEEVRALKTIPLVEADGERNLNPQIGADISIREESGLELPQGDPLRAEEIYTVVAEVPESEIETFTPEAQEGQEPPVARAETLFLSWFVTTGSTHRKGDIRTSLFEGGDIDDFLENVWDMDFDIDTNLAKIFLVLRDERGGISWSEHEFDLVEAQ